MSVSCTMYCMLHTFIKYRNHYTSNIIVAVPMQCCKYYMYMYIEPCTYDVHHTVYLQHSYMYMYVDLLYCRVFF